MIQYESGRIGSIDAKSISEHKQQLKKKDRYDYWSYF